MKKTMQDRFASALGARGEKEVPSRSGKYRTLTRSAGGFYFLGRAGAVRYGTCASKSRAASDAFKKKLLGAEPATVFRANAGDWLEGADAAPCAAGWYRNLPSGDTEGPFETEEEARCQK